MFKREAKEPSKDEKLLQKLLTETESGNYQWENTHSGENLLLDSVETTMVDSKGVTQKIRIWREPGYSVYDVDLMYMGITNVSKPDNKEVVLKPHELGRKSYSLMGKVRKKAFKQIEIKSRQAEAVRHLQKAREKKEALDAFGI